MRTRRALLTLALALGMVPIAAAPGAAAFQVIDQSQEDHTSAFLSLTSERAAEGQSFVAGMSGKLVAISVMPGDPIPAGSELQVRELSGDALGSVLASTPIRTDTTDAWVKFDIDAVALSQGTRYAWVVVSGTGSLRLRTGVDTNAYPQGVVYGFEASDVGPLPIIHDLAFRTHMRVDPGSFSWVSTPTKPSAGATATYRFSLGGSFGLDVIRGGSPTTTRVSCSTGEPIKGTTFRTRPFGGAISYDPSTETYAITWKVRPQWGKGALACRTFEVFVRGEREPHVVVVKVRQPAN